MEEDGSDEVFGKISAEVALVNVSGVASGVASGCGWWNYRCCWQVKNIQDCIDINIFSSFVLRLILL